MREFPRATPGARPTEGDLDELLEVPPDEPAAGVLRADAAGARVRRRIYVLLAIGIGGAFVGGHYAVKWAREREKNPTPHYELAPGTEGEVRPRSMAWSSGFARLGLSRQEPGVQEIVLPDRIIRLAEGCDHAQIKVDVVDGQTVQLKVITGEITSEAREVGKAE
jgi:hypothetical protein